MPIANTTAARDAIYGQLKTTVEASAFPTLPIYYPDTVKDAPKTGPAHLRAFVDLTDEKAATVGGAASRRYRIHGIVMVQVFTPYGDGQVQADLISGVVKGAFRGVNTGADAITFRRARAVDVGHEGPYYQTNVTAEFDYDELG